MDVFLGKYKNTSAAKCALQINRTFLKLIKPKFEAKYKALQDGTYKLAHCTGVDTSEVLVVRAGIRNNNNLIWIGSARNVAAKMSAFRESPYFSFLSGTAYDKLADEAKISNGTNMWEERAWNAGLLNACSDPTGLGRLIPESPCDRRQRKLIIHASLASFHTLSQFIQKLI
jgi:adenylate cyclase